MNKLLLNSILSCCPLFLIGQKVVTFDQLSFSEPQSWVFADNGTYHTYTNVNNANNTFCILSVYTSEVSSGNMDKDFRNAWKGIVAGHFTVIKNLKPQTNKAAGGISYLWDEAYVANDKGSFFARLHVFDLKEKIQSVLFLSGNKNILTQYQPQLDQFISSLQTAKTNNTNPLTETNKTTTIDKQDTNATITAMSSGQVHFNHFIFSVPAGWKASLQGNFYLIVPPDLESDEMLTYIFLPSVTDANFNDIAVSTLKDVASGINGEAVQEQIYGKGPLYIEENTGKYAKGWDYSLGHGTIRMGSTDPNSPGIIFYKFLHAGVFLVRVNSRIERVVYISKDIKRGLAESSTYRKPSYDRIIKEFFFSLEFDDWTDQKFSNGQLTDQGISALWGGTAYFEGALGSTFSEGSVKGTYLAFFDNGQVYYNKELPIYGMRDINTYAEAADFPRWWGTYTYKNGSGVIKLLYETIPFTLKDGKIYLDIYQKKLPYDQFPAYDNIVLNGTWCDPNGDDGKTDCISFTSDGHFIDDGAVLRIAHVTNQPFHDIPESGKGQYEIKNNSIFFKFENGKTWQAAFSGLGLQKGNSSPQQIHLGFLDDVFTKK